MSHSSEQVKPNEPTLSHVNKRGEANMVDVTEKAMTSRSATAEGYIQMSAHTLSLITKAIIKRVTYFLLLVLRVFKPPKNAVT